MIRKIWRPRTPGKSRHKVPGSIKVQVQQKADSLIQSVLKPEHVKSPSTDTRFNYIVDIYSKWYRTYFYFCATYRCPSPDRISEFFESRFARLEYAGNQRFNLSYMRHNGQWVELLADLSLGECLESIRNEPHYLP